MDPAILPLNLPYGGLGGGPLIWGAGGAFAVVPPNPVIAISSGGSDGSDGSMATSSVSSPASIPIFVAAFIPVISVSGGSGESGSPPRDSPIPWAERNGFHHHSDDESSVDD